MKNSILLTAAIAGISFANLGSASATLLSYEGFGYTSAANVTGQTGGSGWRTPVANFPWGTGGTTGTVAASGLTYTGINAAYTAFAPTGLAGNFGGNFRNSRLLAIDTGGVYDNAGLKSTTGNYIGGSTVTSTLWGSYLLSGTNWGASFAIFNLDSTAGTGTRAQIRQGGAGGALQITDASGTNIGGTGSILTSALSTTNPNLIVFRMVFDGANNDTMSVWLNPTAASDTASITATQANFVLNQPELRSVNASGNLVFDEVRFGTTFLDVVPIPEPSTYVMLLGGIGVLLILRRCRRA